MKKLLISLLVATFALSGFAAEKEKEEPKTKTVCLDVQGKDGKPVIDKKTGKPKQNCTKVKVRKKFDGTEVPDKKK